MVEEYRFPQERWSNGLGKDMLGNEGKLGQKGLITKITNFPGSEENRPVGLRVRRVEFYKNVSELRVKHKNGDIDNEGYQSEIGLLMNKLKNNDEIYFNFLEKVKPISVDMGELGVQEANYVDLSFSETDFEKPPIIYIPGISNDVDGSGEFALELALSSKRRVIMITYPESPQGKVAKPFPKAVLKSNNFEPHVNFFEKAIIQIIGDNIDFDMCGVSAGSIMISEISKDKNFADRIGVINLLVPPGITALNILDIKKRLKMESESTTKMEEDGSIGRLRVINPKILKRSKEDIRNSNWTLNFLALKLTQEYKWWEGMGKARIIIAKDDGITYGIKNIDKLRENPNLSIEIIDGGHNGPAVNSKAWVEKMAS